MQGKFWTKATQAHNADFFLIPDFELLRTLEGQVMQIVLPMASLMEIFWKILSACRHRRTC